MVRSGELESSHNDLVGKGRDGPRIRFHPKLERVKIFEGDDIVQEKSPEVLSDEKKEKEGEEKGKEKKDYNSEEERKERTKYIRRWGDATHAQDSAAQQKNAMSITTSSLTLDSTREVENEETGEAEKEVSSEEEDWVDHLQELAQVTKTIRSLERLIIRYRTKIVQETPNAKDDEDMKILNDWKIRIEVSQKQLEKLCVSLFFLSSFSCFFFLLLHTLSLSLSLSFLSSSLIFLLLLSRCFLPLLRCRYIFESNLTQQKEDNERRAVAAARTHAAAQSSGASSSQQAGDKNISHRHQDEEDRNNDHHRGNHHQSNSYEDNTAEQEADDDVSRLARRKQRHGDDLVELLIHTAPDYFQQIDGQKNTRVTTCTTKDVMAERNMLVRTCSDVKMLWNRARGTNLTFMREAMGDAMLGPNGVETLFQTSHAEIQKLKNDSLELKKNVAKREDFFEKKSMMSRKRRRAAGDGGGDSGGDSGGGGSGGGGLWGKIPSMPSMLPSMSSIWGSSEKTEEEYLTELLDDKRERNESEEGKAKEEEGQEEEEEEGQEEEEGAQMARKDVALYVQLQRIVVDLLQENVSMREQLNAYTEAFLRPTLEKDEEFRKKHREDLEASIFDGAAGEGNVMVEAVKVGEEEAGEGKEEETAHRDDDAAAGATNLSAAGRRESVTNIAARAMAKASLRDESNDERRNRKNITTTTTTTTTTTSSSNSRSHWESSKQEATNRTPLEGFDVTFQSGGIGLKLDNMNSDRVEVTEIAPGTQADWHNLDYSSGGMGKESETIEVGDYLVQVGTTVVVGMDMMPSLEYAATNGECGTRGVLSLIAKSKRPVTMRFQKRKKKQNNKRRRSSKEEEAGGGGEKEGERGKRERERERERERREQRHDDSTKIGREEEEELKKKKRQPDMNRFVTVDVGRRVYAKTSRAGKQWSFGEVALVNEERTFDVEFDDGGWRSTVPPEQIRVTEDGATKGKKRPDYFLLSLFVGKAGGGRGEGGGGGQEGEEESEGNDVERENNKRAGQGDASDQYDGLLVSYGGSSQKKMKKKKKKKKSATREEDYDPSNW